MARLTVFVGTFVAAFAILAAIVAGTVAAGLGPIMFVMWLGLKPLPYGLALAAAIWCAIAALIAAGYAALQKDTDK